MHVFIKANLASVIASTADYAITIVAVQVTGMDAVAGGITGTITGGIIHFIIGRQWVFAARQHPAYGQVAKYGLVWLGNLLLNASGMYLLTGWAGIHYIIAKVITSVLVAVFYNYPLQKRFVFRNN